MKLITINTHSLIEEDYEKKLDIFTEAIYDIKPDIIAMQEVNQTASAKKAEYDDDNIHISGSIPLKDDNHALRVTKKLKLNGCGYSLSWLGIKNGYGKFDEGLAIMSLKPPEDIRSVTLSQRDDYNDWRTRKAIGVRISGEWFYSVHTGWWQDDKEPFSRQWERLCESIPKKERVWLMGDFNCPAAVKGEGYDRILSDGWYDSYELARNKDSGYTAHGKIDGWKEEKENKLRIDYIFTNRKINIESSFIIFDGKNKEKVSDHKGIAVTL